MLTKKEREFVYNFSSQSRDNKTRQYFFRIRKKALKALDDLRFLADYLPEDQQAQIFNTSTLIPLIRSIITAGTGLHEKIDPHSLDRFRFDVGESPVIDKKRQVYDFGKAFRYVYDHRRQFHLAAVIRNLTEHVAVKTTYGDQEAFVTPFINQDLPREIKDWVVLNIARKPFGEGIQPLTLYKPGRKIRFGVASKDIKPGEQVSYHDNLIFKDARWTREYHFLADIELKKKKHNSH